MSTTGVMIAPAAQQEQRAALQRVPKTTLIARRFRRNKAAVAGLAIFALLSLLAIAGPFLVPWSYDDLDFRAMRQPPSAAHWLGTDMVGADMFALSVRGLGRSLLIGLIASIGITIIAAFVGTAIAYFEGWREKVGVWLVDMLLVIPTFFLLAIMVTGASGTNGWLWLTAALMLFGWVGYRARIALNRVVAARTRVCRRGSVHGCSLIHDPAPPHDSQLGLDTHYSYGARCRVCRTSGNRPIVPGLRDQTTRHLTRRVDSRRQRYAADGTVDVLGSGRAAARPVLLDDDDRGRAA